MTVLAAATAVAALALVLAAWLVPRGRERRARAALADYAAYFVATVLDHAAWEVGRTLHDRLYVPSRAQMFATSDAAGAGPPGTSSPGRRRVRDDALPSLAQWVAASDRADEGRMVPAVEESLRFRYDERRGALETAGADTAPRLRRWLADTLRVLPRRYGAAPTFLAGRPLVSAVLFPGPRGPGLGAAVRAAYYADGSRVLYGYVGDVRPMLAIAVPDMVARTPLFPQSLRRPVPNRALVALAITTPEGTPEGAVLFADSAAGTVRTAGHPGPAMRFANAAFGGVRITLVPRADAADLLAPALAGGAGPGDAVIPGLAALLLTLLGGTLGGVWVARREAALTAARVRFLAAVSHEFRTPLAQILVAADTLPLLARGTVERPEAREALGAIVHGAERLGHLVDNVLHVARGDHGDPAARRAPLQLAPLLEDVVERFLPVASEADVEVAVDLAADVVVNANRELVTRLVLNLLDNAVKYGGTRGTTDGARPQVVAVSLARCGRAARLTVDDQGPGIPPADRARVWEPFVRLARDAARPGSGLGLAVVRDLARALGGTASVEDAPTGGARFVVELPLAREVPPGGVPHESDAGAHAGAGAASVAGWRGR